MVPLFVSQGTDLGKQQQQHPCASSKLRSGRVKQQQQSILLAAVPRAFSPIFSRRVVSPRKQMASRA